jgi:acyl-CoA reductase-like NAD-dependent aldehyde dehydrogenase
MATQLVVEGELRSVNPATLEVVGSVPIASPAAVAAAVARAAAAQERWAAEPFARRRSVLAGVVRGLNEHMDELAATIVAETGKPTAEAFTHELLLATEQVEWLAREAENVLAPERLRIGIPYLAHKRAYTVYEPMGVIGVIAPWNFPLSIPLTQVATCVAAGNGVVLKPSELTPLTAEWVARLLVEAGAPDGLVSVVQGAGETGAALVRAPGVAKIVFTGSGAVGRVVARDAAELLRPVTLELGGKDPMLVFEDADLERALDGATSGSFANCGQICVGIERIYVQRALYERFVSALADRARELRIGVDVGPLISEGQRGRVEDLVAEAVELGACVRAGARRGEGAGWFYEPTVLEDVPADARIESEEVFGPVATVAPFDGEDEAVRLANGSRFGLGASIWTRDGARARRVGARLDAGMVWTNDVGWSYGAGPAVWGGTKESGFGHTHGKHGLYEVSHVKLVDADSGRVPVPWWYPYDERAVDGFKGVLGVLHGDRKLRALWRHRRGLAYLTRRYLKR